MGRSRNRTASQIKKVRAAFVVSCKNCGVSFQKSQGFGPNRDYCRSECLNLHVQEFFIVSPKLFKTCMECLIDAEVDEIEFNLVNIFVCRPCIQKEIKAKHSEQSAKRRAQELKAMPAWADREAILRVYREAKRRTEETGALHHVDHIVPLQSPIVCGLHIAINLRVITAEENLKKGNRMPRPDGLSSAYDPSL
jgi:hypothetical protein